jgi:twinkle protein
MQKIYDIGLVPKRTELAERFMFPFSQINYLLNGGELDRVTLITSGTDNGKSTISSQIICDVIRQGYNCCTFFGEDTPYESQDRIFKQSIYGKEDSLIYKPYKVNGKETNCGEWVLTEEAYEKARQKFEGKLFLYNTNASAKVEDILEGFEEARVKHGCRVFLLDNVDQFDFSSENENKALKDIIIKIRDYAINKKVHIFLVSHIRKLESGKILPNLDDVKGTSSIVNIAKNVLIVVRTDKCDKESKEYKSLKKLLELNNYDLDQADSLVYVAKTKGRKLGFACLKYNKKTNTYYDCKKIDESKEETEKIEIIAKQPRLTEIADFDDEIFG